MSICKSSEITRKDGCKIEDLTQSPPVLRTNLIPDVNGVTHHNPSLCGEPEQPQDEDIAQKRLAKFKTKFVVNKDIHSENVVDGFRELSGFLWSSRKVPGGNELYHVWTKGDSQDTLLDSRRKYNIVISDDKESSEFGSRNARISIVSIKPYNNSQKIDKLTGHIPFQEFKNEIEQKIVLNKTYKDVVYSYISPFDQDDLREFTILDNNRYKSTWDFRYNFYVQEYENLLNNVTVPHTILPNVHVWFSELFNRENENVLLENSVQRFYDLINLGGALTIGTKKPSLTFPRTARKTFKRTKIRKFDVKETEEFMYYQEWANKFLFAKPEKLSELDKYYMNTIYTSNDQEILDRINKKDTFFPMSIYTSFPTDKSFSSFSTNNSNITNQTFLEALYSTRLDGSLLNYVIKNEPQINVPILDIPNVQGMQNIQNIQTSLIQNLGQQVGNSIFKNIENKIKIYGNFSYSDLFYEQENIFLRKDNDTSTPDDKKTIVSQQRRVWDISKWISHFNNFEQGPERIEKSNFLEIFNTQELDIATFLGSYPLELKSIDNKSYNFFKTIMFMAFSGKIKNMIRPKTGLFRNVHDMFSFGNECYSEQLFFKVSKILNSTGNVLQDFYFVNSTNKKVLEWVDTQVKYNEQYTYRVYVYNLSLCTEYYYKDLSTFSNSQTQLNNKFPSGANVAQMTIEYKPIFLLVEQPYYEFSGKIIDSPPVPPDVEILSFINKENLIKINLRSNTGDFYDFPIVFSQDEQDYVDYLPKKEGKIRFKNDDLPAEYEVFRLDKKPKNILDFQGEGKKVKSKFNAPHVSFLENIEMNVKYYYIFRSVDSHGHVSNPTPIYEVELVNDGGFIFLDISIFTIEQQNMKTFDKNIKNNFEITPSFLQTLIDYENSAGYRDSKGNKTGSAYNVYPKIGTLGESVLDKNFKIRVTSKRSGKKIDFNFKVKHKHDK